MRYLWIVLLAVSVSFAEVVSLPDSLLTSQQKNYLESQKAKAEVEETKAKVEAVTNTVSEIASSSMTWGKQVGEAVKGTLDAVGDFANTWPGKLLLALVVFKVVGTTAVGIGFGIPILLLGTILWTWIYRRNCMIQRVVISKTKDEKKYGLIIPGQGVPEIWNTQFDVSLKHSLGVSRLLHTIVFGVFVIIMIVIIF